MMNESNIAYYNYLEYCSECGEYPADNEVEMYEEEE